MIGTAADIARITAGTLHGDPDIVVQGPAVLDSREAAVGTLFAALPGEHADGHDFASAAVAAGTALVLSSRPVDGPCVVVDDVQAALAELARRHVQSLRSEHRLSVVAVTGSQGKTTVKDMLAQVLADQGPTVAGVGSFNNELGVPLTVLRADSRTRYLVVEMGARGLGHIRYLCDIAAPDVSLVLNVGSAHVGEFGSVEIIARAKGEIVEGLGPDGVAVLNADDPRVAAMAERHEGRVMTFGRSADSVRMVGEVELDQDGYPHVEIETEEGRRHLTVAQIGRHQILNAAATLCAARAVGVPTDDALASLARAEAVSPMRMERVRRADGLLIINDAYNANPESMTAALQALAGLTDPARAVAVLGTMLELGEASEDAHQTIGRLARDLGIGRVIAVGSSGPAIARGAADIAEVAATTDEAIRTLVASLRPEQVVLVKASRGERLERVVDGLLADVG